MATQHEDSADQPAAETGHVPRSASQKADEKVYALPKRRALLGLSRQILALNVLAIALLGATILYVNQSRDGLIETRLKALQEQAELVAAALAEATPEGTSAEIVDGDSARFVLARMLDPDNNRARIFIPDNSLLLDSRQVAPSTQIEMEELPPLREDVPMMEKASAIAENLLRFVIATPDYPAYVEYAAPSAGHYPEAAAALAARTETSIRSLSGDRLMLTVAVPIQRFRRVLGALLLQVETSTIEEAVKQERLAILQVFGAALLVMIGLSLLLARTIARPVTRLADFAYGVRQGRGRDQTAPDFSHRRDEVGDLSVALREMTQALYRRIDAIEAFAADVAHEFKNPLTSMRSALETLNRAKTDDQRQQLLGIVVDDVQRLSRLISDISNASRLDAELMRGEMAAVDLTILLRNIHSVYDMTASDDKAAVKLDIQAEDAFVYGIESHLSQVFRNLVDNAMSFSPASGTVCISMSGTDDALAIRVDDDGPGIPDEIRHKIFDRFFSERSDHHEKKGNSGLGLNICQQIVTVHNGILQAENRTDADGRVLGARFSVSLPRLKRRRRLGRETPE